jgi:hypothetical protein
VALTSPTSVGRSVGIVRSQTQATEFIIFVVAVHDEVFWLGKLPLAFVRAIILGPEYHKVH